jgi:hypothetical protein
LIAAQSRHTFGIGKDKIILLIKHFLDKTACPS